VVSRRGQLFFVVSRFSWSSWSVVFSWSVVLLGRRGQSFFCGQSVVLIVVVSRRGQSFLWSVVLRGQSS